MFLSQVTFIWTLTFYRIPITFRFPFGSTYIISRLIVYWKFFTLYNIFNGFVLNYFVKKMYQPCLDSKGYTNCYITHLTFLYILLTSWLGSTQPSLMWVLITISTKFIFINLFFFIFVVTSSIYCLINLFASYWSLLFFHILFVILQQIHNLLNHWKDPQIRLVPRRTICSIWSCKPQKVNIMTD